MRRAPHSPEAGRRWLIFFRNHREAIAAMDFFSVPTLTFNQLYVFFIISDDRRRILRFNVTQHPTRSWIVQQLRQAFPYEPPVRFLLLDRDSKYSIEVPAAIRPINIRPVRTVVGCPWQNGRALGGQLPPRTTGPFHFDQPVASEAVAGCIRRVLPSDRIHCAPPEADSDSPNPLRRERQSWSRGPVLRGLHHRYERAV